MQAKDIPEAPILDFLKAQNRWCTWFGPKEQFENSVLNAMPNGVTPKLALAKMRKLIRRGVVTGCVCGCRGDFELKS